MVFNTSFKLTDKITEAKKALYDERKADLDAMVENIIQNVVLEKVDHVQMSSLYDLEATIFNKGIQDFAWQKIALKLDAILPFKFSHILREHKPLIFSYLGPAELRNASQVNKEFSQLAGEAKIQWANKYQQPLYKMMRYNQLENLLQLHGRKLEYFNFSSIKIPFAREMFFQWISYCPHITHLILKDCMLSDDDIDVILKLSKVRVLNLSANSLTPVGIAKLVQSTLFSRLIDLDLSHNYIGDDLASQVIKEGENLETLNLNGDLISSGKIGKKTAISVAESLELKKLKNLSLDHNHMDEDCINQIISSSKLGSLESISLSSNPIKLENLSIEISFTTPDYVYYELKNSHQNMIRIRFNPHVH